MLAPVEEELQLASAKCQEALAAPEFAGLDALLPGAPVSSEGWFELLSKCEKDPKAAAALRAMRSALPAELAAAGVTVEHYAVLRALPLAASRIVAVRIPVKIKRFYAELCCEVAARERQWASHFNMEGDPERFSDMVQLATLRRFPAGALNFAFERLAPLRMMLFIRPLALPGYLFQRLVAMPFARPSIGPHVNFGRKHSLILLQTDYERSMWLIAKTIEMDSNISGINGWSWFFSKTTGEVFPHLSWMRDILVDGGAYIIDTDPAEAGGYGFTYNNRKRQILYDEGKFCPRQTAYFWSRNDVLHWASQHPELIPEGESAVQPPPRRPLIHLKSPKPAKHAKRNSSITLWNGKAALDRMGQFNYVALVLVLPALILSLAALLASGPALALIALPVGVYLAFAFQYFFSQ
jgi:hypothetical protein